MATAGVILGLALAATSSYADTKPSPSGSSVGKFTQKARSVVGSSTAVKARTKLTKRAPVHRIKIRTKAKAAPVRTVARRVTAVRTHHATRVVRTHSRKVAPVRTHRAAKVVHTALKRAHRPVTVHPRISSVQRKTAATPAVRAVRNATAPRAHRTDHATVPPTKINRTSSKIIKSSLRKATTAKTIPSVTVGDLPVKGLSVVTPQITVRVRPLQVSVPPVAVTVPQLGLPPVTVPGVQLPPIEPPTVTLPATDPPVLTSPGNHQAVADPAALRAAPIGGSSRAPAREIGRTPKGMVAASLTFLAAHPPSTLSVQATAIASIGPPAVAILEELGQRIGSAKVPVPVGPTAALVLAAAIGAAATGTAGSGSANTGGLAVLSAALRLPALGGSRRLNGRLRAAASRRPRQPGFSPD